MNTNTKEKLINVINTQREFLKTKKLLSPKYRAKLFTNLYREVSLNLPKIHLALAMDLGKATQESFLTETGPLLSFLRCEIIRTHLLKKEKKGKVSLIITPFTFPFFLPLFIIVNEISRGNTVIVKPSGKAQNTAKCLKEILEAVFPSTHCYVLSKPKDSYENLLSYDFDKVIFLGKQKSLMSLKNLAGTKGKKISYLCGGKNPAIVTDSCDLKLTAKRIIYSKFLNCGQSGFAVDYILCQRKIKDKFLLYLTNELELQLSTDPFMEESWGKIIDNKNYKRLLALINQDKTLYGGAKCNKTTQIGPVIMEASSFTDKIMQEEILGPILPILEFENLKSLKNNINDLNPLYTFLFTKDKKVLSFVKNNIRVKKLFLNETAPLSNLSFFTKKDIIKGTSLLDLPIRYKPYTDTKDFFAHLLSLF